MKENVFKLNIVILHIIYDVSRLRDSGTHQDVYKQLRCYRQNAAAAHLVATAASVAKSLPESGTFGSKGWKRF